MTTGQYSPDGASRGVKVQGDHDERRSSRDDDDTTRLDDDERKIRILIIGAGYAGLTLANLLLSSSSTSSSSSQQPSDEHDGDDDDDSPWSVDVVERLHPPRGDDGGGNVIHGTIRVPFARRVLPRMRHLDATRVRDLLLRQPRSRRRDDDRLSENDLLDVLRAHVPVRYRHQADEILCCNHKRASNAPTATWHPSLRVAVRQRTSSLGYSDPDETCGCTTWWGPYDWVIAADGALSRFRRLSSSHRWRRVLSLGDAQWVHGRWWDLGRRRLGRGADLALRQATQLADAFRTMYRDNNKNHDDDDDDDPSQDAASWEIERFLDTLRARPKRTPWPFILVVGILLSATVHRWRNYVYEAPQTDGEAVHEICM